MESIEEIVEYIKFIHIEKLSISARINNENLELLKKLQDSRTLKNLTIFEIPGPNSMDKEMFLRGLEFLRLDEIQIQDLKHDDPKAENLNWYH